MATLLTRTDEIRRCYERELKQRPRLCGSLGVRFTIAAGHVIQVTQTRWRKNQSSAPLLDCVTRAVRRLKFPKTKGHKDEYTENFQFFDFSAPHPR